jgi:uncharacterized protein YecE (DUF72 family)
MTPTLFPPDPDPGGLPPSDTLRDTLRESLQALARRGLFLGTSSWKYPGWLGQIYTPDLYLHRNRHSEARFERLCLTEYASVFPTVCVDAAYYRFPDARFLDGLAAQVPPDFRFTFKVTDDITIRRFPNLPRFGPRAGQINPHFLDADLFQSAFLTPCEPHRERIGVLIFEFSRFHPADFVRGRDFAEALDAFLGKLPLGWRYGVEIRNPGFLHPDYFAMLHRHGVAHVFNSWEAMPALAEQTAMPGAFSSPEFTAARLLLRPGRPYAQAVERFAPYDRIQDEYAAGREAAAALVRAIHDRAASTPRSGYLYANNRFEGNAPLTLALLLAHIGLLARHANPTPAPPA